jgi:regulator of protease activity HflC (stomatin/prohibitin superfamily)
MSGSSWPELSVTAARRAKEMVPMTAPIVVIVILAIMLLLAFSSIRIAREYERGVVFRLGRLIELKGPGLFLIVPFGVDRLTKVTCA